MLGLEISDPEGAEGGGTVRGMELLSIKTVFAPEKHQVRARGAVGEIAGPLAALSGTSVEGYEIHMGETVLKGGRSFCELSSSVGSSPDGCAAGNVYGTYLHGVFDSAELTDRLVGALASAKGLDASLLRAVDMAAYKQRQYDKLADALRAGLDMDMVYRIVEAGV